MQRQGFRLPEHHFNSTMVRLKDFALKLIRGKRISFQFHYGAIKSFKIALKSEIQKQFQFHYGAIKSSKSNTI